MHPLIIPIALIVMFFMLIGGLVGAAYMINDNTNQIAKIQKVQALTTSHGQKDLKKAVYILCLNIGHGKVQCRELSKGEVTTLHGSPAITGKTGNRGPRGAQGAQGVQGVPGSRGEPGAKGSTGVGVKGAPGPRGMRGRSGANGRTGARGAPGPAGPQGAQGAQGPQGPAGSGCPAGSHFVRVYIPSVGRAWVCVE